MGNGFLIVTEDDWENATPEQQSKWVFRTLKSLDARMQKLEKRPLTDKVYSFAGGIIGGVCAYFGAKII